VGSVDGAVDLRVLRPCGGPHLAAASHVDSYKNSLTAHVVGVRGQPHAEYIDDNGGHDNLSFETRRQRHELVIRCFVTAVLDNDMTVHLVDERSHKRLVHVTNVCRQ
jgi:hypothetical protein